MYHQGTAMTSRSDNEQADLAHRNGPFQDCLRLGLYRALALLPGRSGEQFGTRYHWVRRRFHAKATEAAFEACLSGLGEEDCCVDLGANVGAITARLALHAGQVHAFEPEPWAFAQLSERVGANPRVFLHNAAAGGQDGTLELMRDPAFDENRAARSQGTSAFLSNMWEGSTTDRFRVEVVDICRFLRALDRRVSILKIDIEGAEVELLETLLASPERDLVDVIFVETHEAQIPSLRARTHALRQSVRGLTAPVVHLDWQ